MKSLQPTASRYKLRCSIHSYIGLSASPLLPSIAAIPRPCALPREARLFTSSRRFRCSWLPEISGEYPAALDKECGEVLRGSSRRSPRASVLSNVCGSGDQGHRSPSGMLSVNCARSWIAGKQPTSRRIFIGAYEFSWSCSAKAQPHCKNGHEPEGQMQETQRGS
jgi:hypothetical protein